MSFAFSKRMLQNTNIPNEIANVKKKAYFTLIRGIGTIVASFAFSYYMFNITDNNKTLKNKKRNNIMFWKMAFTGALLMFEAIRCINSYKPSNTEISMALLIQYLKEKQILDPEMFEVLKKCKPYRIETLNIK
jgi:hypothetical protein